MTLVHCRGVTRTFGEGAAAASVLRGVDLDVHPGELTFLVGPSGCGKTTLLSVIAGLLAPTAGEVSVLGDRIFELDDTARVIFRRRNVGFVFQQHHLVPALDATENVAVPLLAAGAPHREALDRAREKLVLVGLEDRARARTSALSGGQQQRVAIARALVSSPRLLVCDEPTSALDTVTGSQIMELLREVAVDAARAVVVVTHDARVLAWADRVVRMEDGRIVSVEGGA